jgi:hypothetical protein
MNTQRYCIIVLPNADTAAGVAAASAAAAAAKPRIYGGNSLPLHAQHRFDVSSGCNMKLHAIRRLVTTA